MGNKAIKTVAYSQAFAGGLLHSHSHTYSTASVSSSVCTNARLSQSGLLALNCAGSSGSGIQASPSCPSPTSTSESSPGAASRASLPPAAPVISPVSKLSGGAARFFVAAQSRVTGCVFSRCTVRAQVVRGTGQGIPLSRDLVVERVEILGGGAVEVEPPVADEVVLVEESSVGAEETVLGQTSGSVSCADVESLALSFGVRVVTCNSFG